MVGGSALLFIFPGRQLIYHRSCVKRRIVHMRNFHSNHYDIMFYFLLLYTTLKISINVVCVGTVRQLTSSGAIISYAKYSVYATELTRHCFS